MAKREHRLDTARQATIHQAVVVIEGRLVDDALLLLDATPLNGEAIRVEPHLSNTVEVVLPTLPAAAGVSRGLLKNRRLHMLQEGGVGSRVAAVGLVARRRHAPEEVVEFIHIRPFSMVRHRYSTGVRSQMAPPLLAATCATS